MTDASRHIPSVSTKELVGRLAAAAGDERCIVAFDGDGTLWSGDVSDDVFFEACKNEWLLEDARDALAKALTACGLSDEGSLGNLGVRLYDGHRQGVVPERLLFEAMTYCYAGRSAKELSNLAAEILRNKQLEKRIRHEIVSLLEWSRARGHECYLVTASPAPIVSVPAKQLGFDESNIVASSATDTSGVIRSEVTAPIPYREGKVTQLRQRTATRRLLAAFGDSPFDIDLLSEATVAVAVEPKAGLLAEMSKLPGSDKVRWLPHPPTILAGLA